MRGARTWRLTFASLLAVTGAQLMPFAAAHADNPPTALVTSQVNGDTLQGTTTISGTGSVDPAGSDVPQSLQLFVNGAAIGSPQLCPTAGNPTDCSLSFSYDFTDDSGSYTLDVKFVTVAVPGGVMSPDVSVNVTSPPVSAAVTSPGAGASVSGNVTNITASGTVDSSQTDTPVSLTLLVDGVVSGSTHTCASTPNVCSFAGFSYDFTGSTTSHSLAVRFVSTTRPSGTRSIDSPSVSVNASSPVPTAAISTPTAGQSVVGVVPVTATGTVDASQNDTALSMRLYVDGTASGAAQSCGSTSKTCSKTFSYDATGRSDSPTFKVLITTTRGASGFSPDVAVNASTPTPTAAVTSPSGTSVSGVVGVVANGTIPGAESYTPTSLQLMVDGSLTGSAVSCAGLNPCSPALPWDSTNHNGSHTLAVRFVTGNGGPTVTSSAVSFTVVSPPPTAVVLSPVFGSAVSGVVSVSAKGTVDASQSDTPATLQLLVDGVAKGSPQACPTGQGKSCPVTFSYDLTGLTGTHSVAARFVTGNAISVDSPFAALIVASPLPAVSLTSPAAGATVSGVVSVSVSAQVDASQTDAAAAVRLFVDGAASGASTACPASADPKACAVSLSWDSTGLTGTHVLQAMLSTTHGVTGASPQVTVTVANPAPTVAILSPTSGATVTGTVAVSVSAAVNASLTDTAGTVKLAVDGVARGGAQACSTTAGPKSCAASLSFNSVGLAGQHTLTVTFTTARGATAVATEKVYVFSPTKTVLTSVAPTVFGHLATVKGKITATANDSAASHQTVDITFAPAVGKKHTVVTHTDSVGRYSVGYKVAANTTVTVKLAGASYYGVSSATGKIKVTAGVSCAKAGARHGASLAGSCKVPGLAKGSKVSMQVKVGSHWVVVGSAKAAAGKVAYKVKFAKAGTYAVRLMVAAGKAFVAGAGSPFRVVVS
jgi:Bacterial Ig domain